MSRKKLKFPTLGPRLKQAREFLGLSQGALAERVEGTKSLISKIEGGSANPSARLLDALEFRWGISKEWLRTGEGEMIAGAPASWLASPLGKPAKSPRASPPLGEEDTPLGDYAEVPIVAVEAAAGLPQIAGAEYVIDQAIVHKVRLGKGRHVAFRAYGNSMEPLIRNGAICIANVDRTNPGRALGQIVVAYVFGGVTIKWITRSGDHFMLVSENREYPPVLLDFKEARIVGVVEWWEGLPPKEKK